MNFIGIHLDASARLANVKLSEIPAQTGSLRPLIAAIIREEELIIPRGKGSSCAQKPGGVFKPWTAN